jgi:hypothetical protein
MRKVFIETEVEATVWDYAPWACAVVEVDGGYMAFESWDDLDIWQNQI